MIYPAPSSPASLSAGRKVADRYNIPIYVFQTGTPLRADGRSWIGGLAAVTTSGTDCNAQR
jgi:hypothetical protein